MTVGTAIIIAGTIIILVGLILLLNAAIIHRRFREDPSHGCGWTLVSKHNIGDGVVQYVYYDPETLVMYAYLDRYGNAGGITVMYNDANGTLKTFSPQK